MTGVVALAGLGATLRTASQGRKHAERLAADDHRRARDETLRQDRLHLYADALMHAVDLERRLAAVWVSTGGEHFEMSVQPRGGPVTLTSMDDITVRMRLYAGEDVEAAWAALNAAWEDLQWWGQNSWSGDPGEDPPTALTAALQGALASLTAECRRSVVAAPALPHA